MHLTRAKVGIAGLAVVAAGVPLGSSLASGSPAAAKPAAGVIQLFASNSTATGDSPNKILIVGAFSDHGTGLNGTFHLKKGTITIDASAIVKQLGAPNAFKVNTTSCSFWARGTAPVPIVKGTGAYVGIKGTFAVTFSEAGIAPRTKAGQCITNPDASSVAQAYLVSGSGRVSF